VAGGSRPSPNTPFVTSTIPYADVAPILERLKDRLPPELGPRTPVELQSAWLDWVSGHKEEIRQRLERGDQDSLINLWYYGTSFTRSPPLSVSNIVAFGLERSSRIAEERLQDLIIGIAAPGRNERLQFARGVISRQVSDPTTADGKDAVRRHLRAIRERNWAEREKRRTLRSATDLDDREVGGANGFTLFHQRRLSSDTSILPCFTIEEALREFKSGAAGMPELRNIRRVAIVGPGLDFTDKAEGYDFYPLQTIQPFAVVDSLIRLGLSKLEALRVAIFDVSPRITQHIETARQRGRSGNPYVLQLPLDRDEPWNPALIAYWRRLGETIGEEVEAIAAPPATGNVAVRAVSIRPDVVTAVTAQELNVVLERIDSLPIEEQFDLVIATNILIYYDLFDQNLALANISRMLRPGGLLVANTRVFPAIALELLDEYFKISHNDTQNDYLFWYRRE
jgi:hypothetical protein